jgi:two-component system, NarL family, response regulator LiaR
MGDSAWHLPDRDPIRVVIVDDHELFRSGLAGMLSERGLAVVGTAGSGEEGIALAERFHPDVVLMDLNLPGMSGVEATGHVTRSCPGMCVVVLTAMTVEEDVIDAILAGASSALLNEAPIDELVAGVHATARGD